MKFDFYAPTKIIFGENATVAVGRYTKQYSNNILLVLGQSSAKKTGLYQKVAEQLKKEEIKFHLLEGVKPNPTVDFVKEGIEIIRKKQH